MYVIQWQVWDIDVEYGMWWYGQVFVGGDQQVGEVYGGGQVVC